MLIGVGLFVLVILISLILAFRSMRDYADMPVYSSTPYSLYLVKNEAGINTDFLESIDQIINQKRLIISFERLYKGTKKALVVYGPVVILKQFADSLGLMELEDYSLKYNKDSIHPGILAWEISSRDYHKADKQILNLAKIPVTLNEWEEIWVQFVVQPKCEKNGLQPLSKALIRITVITQDANRATEIKSEIDNLVKTTNLVTVPQVYSTISMIKFYQSRSLSQKLLGKEGGHFIASLDDVQSLLG